MFFKPPKEMSKYSQPDISNITCLHTKSTYNVCAPITQPSMCNARCNTHTDAYSHTSCDRSTWDNVTSRRTGIASGRGRLYPVPPPPPDQHATRASRVSRPPATPHAGAIHRGGLLSSPRTGPCRPTLSRPRARVAPRRPPPRGRTRRRRGRSPRAPRARSAPPDTRRP